MSVKEADLADRLAITELVNRYAQRVDHHDAAGVAELFCEKAALYIYGRAGSDDPTALHTGRGAIEAAIEAMTYTATCHLIGNHVATLAGDDATGETRCVAHHISREDGSLRDRVWYLRYYDRFRREDGTWRIAERVLRVDFQSSTPL